MICPQLDGADLPDVLCELPRRVRVAGPARSASWASRAGFRRWLALFQQIHAASDDLPIGFTDHSGVLVGVVEQLQNVANQLVQEGAATPADVFVTENTPAMTLVNGSHGFAPVQPQTLTQVPARFAPADGNWVGFASRATVLAYNPGKLLAADLPASILDLAGPRWKGGSASRRRARISRQSSARCWR